MPKRGRLCLAAAVATILASQQDAGAATRTWAPGTGGSTDFNAGTNWTGGLPGTADIATFLNTFGTGTNLFQPNLTGSISVSGLNFSNATASAYVISSADPGFKLTLLSTSTTSNVAAITTNHTAGTNTINASLILGAASGFQSFITTSGGTLTINGDISSTNTVGLQKSSGGILNLNGTNTYTGGTNINGGLLRFNSAASIPTTGTITIGAAGALSVSGAYSTLAGWMGDSHLSTSSSGALALTADNAEDFNPSGSSFHSLFLGAAIGASVNYTGTITANTATDTYLVGGGGGTITFSNANAFTGASKLTTGVNGTVIISGSNSYTGLTSVSAGQFLHIQNAKALGTTDAGTTVAAGGTLILSNSIKVVGEDLTIAPVASSNSMPNGLISSSGLNEWAGNISSSGSTTNWRISSSADLLTLSGAVNGVGTNFTTSGASGVTGLVLAGSGDMNVTGAIGGKMGLIFTHSGVITLSDANTYTGDTRFQSSGVVNVTTLNDKAGTMTSSSLGRPTDGLGLITLGSTSGGVSGYMRYVGAGESTDRQIFLQNDGTASGTGTIEQAGTGLLKFTGGVITSAGSGSKTLLLSGSSSGTGEISGNIVAATGGVTGITKGGIGLWTLSGTGNNYTGTTTVTGGTLVGNQVSGNPFGVGAVTIGGATSGAGVLSVSPTGSGSDIALTGGTTAAGTLFTYNAGGTFFLNKGDQSSLTYTFGGTGNAFARGSNGTLTISVSDLTKLGETVANGGERFIINGTSPAMVNTLVSGLVGQDRKAGNQMAGDFLTYDGSNGFKKAAYTSTNSFANTSTDVVEITNTVATPSAATQAYALKVSGTVNNTGNVLTLGSSGNTNAGLILNGGTISGGTLTTPSSSATELNIYVSAAGGTISSAITTQASQTGLSVTGPGTLNLSGSSGNTISGGLRITDATVIVNNNNQLGNTTASITLNGGTIQTSGTVALGGGNRAIVVNSGSNGTGGTFDVVSGTTTIQNSSTGSKVLTGAGTVTKNGAGILVISGNTSNNYSGGTIINAGTFRLGNSNRLLDSGAVTINGGTFDLVNFSETVGDVTLAGGSITTSGGTLTGASYNLRSGTVAGVLGGSNVVMTKSTSGTVDLSGTNSMTGTAIVNGGTLAVSGSLNGVTVVSVGGGLSAAILAVNGTVGNNAAVTVKDAGTVRGTSTINGSVTVESGGSLAPGNSSTGKLTVTNGLSLKSNAHFALEIGGNAAGVSVNGYDQIAVNGGDIGLAGDLSGAHLINGFVPQFEDVFYVILNNGSGTTTGTLAGAGQGGTVFIDGQEFLVSFNADAGSSTFFGTGNDVALMAVPEPGTMFALWSGVGMLVGLRRFRRRVE